MAEGNHQQTDRADNPATPARSQHVTFPDTDLNVRVTLDGGDLTMEVLKAGTLVYRVVVEQAAGPIESAWIVDLFMRNDRVRLSDMAAEIAEYLESLDSAQG